MTTATCISIGVLSRIVVYAGCEPISVRRRLKVRRANLKCSLKPLNNEASVYFGKTSVQKSKLFGLGALGPFVGNSKLLTNSCSSVLSAELDRSLVKLEDPLVLELS